MICYMLIMNMPLWITVYLRNKWCLNLESQGGGETELFFADEPDMFSCGAVESS